jgi:hypothetical protein
MGIDKPCELYCIEDVGLCDSLCGIRVSVISGWSID